MARRSCRSLLAPLLVASSLGALTWGCGTTEDDLSVDPAGSGDDMAASDDDSTPGFDDADDDAPAADDDAPAPAADDDGAAGDDDAAPSPTAPADDDVPMGDDDLADDDLPLVPVGDDDASDDDDVAPTPMPGGLGGVGDSCETDGDCASGMSCLDESTPYFGGVYPHGICTASCAGDPYLCDALGGGCIGDETEALCLPLCQIGGTGIKCRADQTCVLADPTYSIGFCDAMCRDDMDCPADLFCDGSLGLCMEEPAAGLEVGEPCTSGDECAGHVCLPPTPDGTSGVCSAFCNLPEGLSPCARARDTVDPAPGACDIVTSSIVNGVYLAPGDMGICSATCDIGGDPCEPGWTCAELIPEVAEMIGHDGLCLFSDLVATPDAGAP